MASQAKKSITIIVAGPPSPPLSQLSIILERLGYLVHLAHNGEKVLQVLQSVAADLIICDGHLPAKDGFSILEQVRKQPHRPPIPVIMLTESFSKTSEDEYIRFGYSGILRTPIDLRKLNILVQEYLTPLSGEGRKNLRIPFQRKVALIHEGRKEKYDALNLSEGGIYLGTSAALSIGTEVEMELGLQNDRPLRLTGEVIYHRGSYSDVFKVAPGMAVKFTDLSQSATRTLAEYITETLMGDIRHSAQQMITSN